jgi:hypothetical protein
VHGGHRGVAELAEWLVGKVVDVVYDDLSKYRVLVAAYLPEEGFHRVDSEGLSTDEGGAFDDVLDRVSWHGAGRVAVLSGLPTGKHTNMWVGGWVWDQEGAPPRRSLEIRDASVENDRELYPHLRGVEDHGVLQPAADAHLLPLLQRELRWYVGETPREMLREPVHKNNWALEHLFGAARPWPRPLFGAAAACPQGREVQGGL